MNEEILLRELMRGLYRAINTMKGQIVVFTPRKLLAFAGLDEYYSGRKVVKYLLALVDGGYIRVYDIRYRRNTYNPRKPKAVHYFAVTKDDKAYSLVKEMTEEEFVKEMAVITKGLLESKQKQKAQAPALAALSPT